MGGMSAMSSIGRVLEKHGDELKQEMMEQVPQAARDVILGVELDNEVYHIQANWLTPGGGRMPGPRIDIDTLAERFPDCEVGY